MLVALLDAAFEDPVILWMAALVAALVISVAVVAQQTVSLRYANMRKEKAWADREAVWRPMMVKVLAGESPPGHLQALVTSADRFLFIDFLTRYASRFDDHERRMIETMAEPHLPLILPRLHSPDLDLRTRAVMTVGMLGTSSHAGLLVEALEAEEPLIVLTAARALCRLQDEECVRAVLERIHVANAWSINFLSRVLASAGAAAKVPCREVLRDTRRSPWIRILTAETLRVVHDLASPEVARDLIRSEPSTPRDVLCACLRLIRDLGTERHLDAARDLWGAEDDAVRLSAVSALGGAGTREDLPRLRLMIQDDNQWVVWAAIRGILELGDRGFLEDLVASGHTAGPAAAAVLAEAAAGRTVPGIA